MERKHISTLMVRVLSGLGVPDLKKDKDLLKQ
jgi:hypothetical protein